MNREIIVQMENAGWMWVESKEYGGTSVFKKDNKRVWQAVNTKNIEWRYAELIDECYKNHKWVTIEELLTNE